jgi:hypothetical protein
VADYAQLTANIPKLKRAAIDAWMKQEGWEIEGGRYHGPHGADYEVTRPDDRGEGGGDWHGEFFQEWFVGGDKDRHFSGEFDKIRGNIDTAIKRWLPDAIADPTGFDSLITAMKGANTKLALSASASGGSVSAGGSIAGNIQGLKDETDKLSGRTIDAFRSKFVLQLDRVVGGEHAITVVLGGALSAEQKIWENAKTTVADIVEKATNSFNAYANGNGNTDWGLVLKVIGVAVEGVAAFASSGATVALSAGTGIKLLQAGQEAADKKGKNPPSPDYTGIMKGFTQALDDLDAAITSEEKSLATNLRDNYDYIVGLKGTPESLDLNPALLEISDDSQAQINVIHSAVDAITETYMPAIAASLTQAAEDVDAASSSTPWIREESVGYTNYGCWSDLYTLLWLLYELLQDLSWEVSNGGRTLALVIEDIGVQDTDAQDALEQHAAKVKEGSGYVPFPEPVPPTGRGGLQPN